MSDEPYSREQYSEIRAKTVNAPGSVLEALFATLDARDAEIARLREALREAAAVMRGFVDKCDRGEARSVRTYAACKVALAKIESALAEGAKS